MSAGILAKLVVTIIVLIRIWLALEKHQLAWLSDRYFG